MSKRQVKNYTVEFRKRSAKLAVESDQLVTLHGWVNKYYPNIKQSCNTPKEDPQVELKRLKKELSRVKQERDILKKATAYFAIEAQ